MKTIREVGLDKLTWARKGDRHELRAGKDLVATLQLLKGASLFLGEAADGQWTFKRTGWLCPKVTVRRKDDTTDVITFTPSTGGALEFPDGRRYFWASTQRGPFPSPPQEWSFKDTDGDVLVWMNLTGTAPVTLSAEVTVSRAALALPDLSLLTLLGWYVLVLTSNDAAEAAALAMMTVTVIV
jgi:hypothetical protein